MSAYRCLKPHKCNLQIGNTPGIRKCWKDRTGQILKHWTKGVLFRNNSVIPKTAATGVS